MNLNDTKSKIFSYFRIKPHGKKAQAILDGKLKQLFETIRDYKDPKSNRQVATIFMKLPSKMVSKPALIYRLFFV